MPTSRSCLHSGWQPQRGRSNDSEGNTIPAASMSWPAPQTLPSVSRGTEEQPKTNIKPMQPSVMDALSMIISSMSQPLLEGSDSPNRRSLPADATKELQQTVADLPDIKSPTDLQAPAHSASLRSNDMHSAQDLDQSVSAAAGYSGEASAGQQPTLSPATQPSTAETAIAAADHQADLSDVTAADTLLPARWPTPPVQSAPSPMAPAASDEQQQDDRSSGAAYTAEAMHPHGIVQLRADAEASQQPHEDVASAPVNDGVPQRNSVNAANAHAHSPYQQGGVEAAGCPQLQAQDIRNDLADAKTQSLHQPLIMPGLETSSDPDRPNFRSSTEAVLTSSGAPEDLALGTITGQALQEAAPLQEVEALSHLPPENLRAPPGKLPGFSRRQGAGSEDKNPLQNLACPTGASFSTLQDESALSDIAPDPPLALPLIRSSIRDNALDALQQQVTRGRAGLTGSKAFRQGLHRLQEDIASAYGTESGGQECSFPLLGLPGGYGSMRQSSTADQEPSRIQPAEDLAASIADAIAQALEKRQGRASHAEASETISQASDLLPGAAPSARNAATEWPDTDQSRSNLPADGISLGAAPSVARAHLQAQNALPLFKPDRPDESAVSAPSLMGIPDAAEDQHDEAPHGISESTRHAKLMLNPPVLPPANHEGLDIGTAQSLSAASRPCPKDTAAHAQSTDVRHGASEITRHAMPMLNLSTLPMPTHQGPAHHSAMGSHLNAAHPVPAAASLASWKHGSSSQGSSSSSSVSLEAAVPPVQQNHVPALAGDPSGLPPFSSGLHADMYNAAVPDMLTRNTSAAMSSSCSTCSSRHASSVSEMEAPLQHGPPHAMPSAPMSSSSNSSNAETGLQAANACHGSVGSGLQSAAGPVQASVLMPVHDNEPACSHSADGSRLGSQQHKENHQEAGASVAKRVVQQGNEHQSSESSSSVHSISAQLQAGSAEDSPALPPDSAPRDELPSKMAPATMMMSLLSASSARFGLDPAAAHELSGAVAEPLLAEHWAPSDYPSGEAEKRLQTWWVKAAADSIAVTCIYFPEDRVGSASAALKVDTHLIRMAIAVRAWSAIQEATCSVQKAQRLCLQLLCTRQSK